jgi:hypothetical protein
MIRAIYSILSANTELNALVTDRIYPLYIPQKENMYPTIVLEQTSNNPSYCKGGKFEEEHILSLVVYAKSYSDSVKVVALLKKILDTITGEFAEHTIRSIKHLNDFPDYNPDTNLIQNTIDFSVKIQPK